MKLRYDLSDKGTVDGFGRNKNFPFIVDKNTPFQTRGESRNWRKINGIWEEYDSDWTYEEYDVKVTIDQTDILDNDNYIDLIGHVKGLINSGKAKMNTINGKREMYFERLLPAHETLLKKDKKVIIKKK